MEHRRVHRLEDRLYNVVQNLGSLKMENKVCNLAEKTKGFHEIQERCGETADEQIDNLQFICC